MDGNFGSRLRTQREQQQVPLSVIAERTKIKASLLEALERNDVSQWPTGIFRRSFVKTYAQAIGLDAETVLREFTELFPEPPEEDVTLALAAAADGRRPPTRLGYLISSAISALPGRVGARRAPAEPALAGPAEAGLPVEPVMSQSPHVEFAVAPAEAELYVEPQPEEPEPVIAEPIDAPAMPAPEPALSEVADLCTRLARALQPRDVPPVLADAARILHACGVIVWMWDPATRTLGHVLAHGYSSDVLARVPRVRCDTDNAIADAFRTGATRIVNGSGAATGAVVVPILTAGGCAGVLALELQDRGEEREGVRAVAAILAAQFAALFGFESMAEAVSA
jgi:hypothetical protein